MFYVGLIQIFFEIWSNKQVRSTDQIDSSHDWPDKPSALHFAAFLVAAWTASGKAQMQYCNLGTSFIVSLFWNLNFC